MAAEYDFIVVGSGAGGGAIRICPPPGRSFSRDSSAPCESSVTAYAPISPSVSDIRMPFIPEGVFSALRSTPVLQPAEQRNEAKKPTS